MSVEEPGCTGYFDYRDGCNIQNGLVSSRYYLKIAHALVMIWSLFPSVLFEKKGLSSKCFDSPLDTGPDKCNLLLRLYSAEHFHVLLTKELQNVF